MPLSRSGQRSRPGQILPCNRRMRINKPPREKPPRRGAGQDESRLPFFMTAHDILSPDIEAALTAMRGGVAGHGGGSSLFERNFLSMNGRETSIGGSVSFGWRSLRSVGPSTQPPRTLIEPALLATWCGVGPERKLASGNSAHEKATASR